MLKNILAATEQPAACDEKILAAGLISKRYNSKLFLLHVLESESTIYRNYVKHFKTGEEIVCDREYMNCVKNEISGNCKKFLTALSDPDIVVVPGFPWEEILKNAKNNHADLIILGPHGEKAAIKGIGNTAKKVIKRARCPIMIVGRPLPEKMMEFKKIMISIDFSPSCVYAYQYGLKLAKEFGSSVMAFHMVPVRTDQKSSEGERNKLLAETRNKLEEFYGKISEKKPDTMEIREGITPHMEILQCATDNDVDLILMGSHTKGDVPSWYIGSAVEKVSKKSTCPVLVVTDPKALVDWNAY
jgi:nucleotide-binding universal stress UspA family protein